MRRLVILCLLIMAACAPTSGRVQNKYFSPAHSQYMVALKQTTWIPDAWYLTICDDNGKCGDVRVDQDVFDRTQMGDTYGVGQ